MSRPLRIYNTSDLAEMSDAEIKGRIVPLILDKFASDSHYDLKGSVQIMMLDIIMELPAMFPLPQQQIIAFPRKFLMKLLVLLGLFNGKDLVLFMK
jgi:hypothetical protein